MGKINLKLSAKRIFRDWVLHNFGLKVVSLLMAFTLWYNVTGGPQSEVAVVVELAWETYIPQGWVTDLETQQEVELRLRGRDNVIRQLRNRNAVNELVRISIDRSQIEMIAEIQRIELDPSRFSLPLGVQVLEVKPQVALLKLDREVTQQKPIRIDTSGSPGEGYRLLGMRVRPESVAVTGPEKVISPLEEVAGQVSIEGLDSSAGSRVVQLERINRISYSDPMVEVELDIVEVNETRKFTLTEDNFRYGATQDIVITVRPRTFEVSISGPRSWINALAAEEIIVSIDPLDMEIGETSALRFVPERMILFNKYVERPELIEYASEQQQLTITVRPAS